MDENDIAVKADAQAAATEEGVETSDPQAPGDQGIDYEAEFKSLVERNRKLEDNQENYKKGILIAKGKMEGNLDDLNLDLDSGNTDKLDKVIEAKVNERLASFQSSLNQDTVESILNQLSTNPAEQKLIQFHFEHTINPVGSIRERLEAAHAIANRKKIQTQTSELKTALRNRTQVSNISQGSSQVDKQPVRDNLLTQDQEAYFKKIGWDQTKIDAYKKNLKLKIQK